MIHQTALGITLAAASLISTSFLARGQDQTPKYQVGIVYYAEQGAFKALDKEVEVQSGRRNYVARVKGAHAVIRLTSGQAQTFRVCSADPSRFKLYRFKSGANSRSVTLAKINIWVGGSKTVMQESEIPITIQPADSACFTLVPQKTLEDGEYGFSPDGSFDAFMFGVGVAREDHK